MISLAHSVKFQGRGEANHLIRHGFRSVREVADAEAYELANLLNLEEDYAQAVIDSGERALERLILEEAEARKAAADLPPSADDI